MAQEWARAFYKSKEWADVRAYVLMRDKYLCVHCGAPGEEVHHIIHLSPDNIGNPNITLNPNNLELLCRNCHQRHHNHDKGIAHIADNGKKKLAESMERNFIFDSNGQLVPRV